MADYKQITIDKFSGLNSNTDSSLIDDSEARDILNLRHEKIGKLTTRDGYSIALFYKPFKDGTAYSLMGSNNDILRTNLSNAKQYKDPIDATELETFPRQFKDNPIDISSDYFKVGTSSNYSALKSDELAVRAMINNQGVVAIGEYCLDTYWDVIDSDRMMVYFVRSIDKDDLGNNLGIFLFSPITGKYKDQIIYPHELITKGAIAFNNTDNSSDLVGPSAFKSKYPHGTFMSEKLLAPDRNSDDWISKYSRIKQYKNKLIISDKTNGDMQIIDSQILEDNYQQRSDSKHSLSISPNCLDTFDVDIVNLDNRFESGLENDISKGVTTNMALYQFEVQKNTTIPYQNNGPVLTCNGNSVTNYTNTKSVFSTENSVYEFDDLMKPLELKQEEYTDEEGIKQTQKSADVYIWGDYQLRYYPSTGKELNPVINPIPSTSLNTPTNDNNYYLTNNDREFNKVNPNIAKTIELSSKKNIAKNAPLGVWQYRFMWEYDDGQLSAPSAEIMAPDIMWSAVPTPNSVFHSSWLNKRAFIGDDIQRPTLISSYLDEDSATNFYTNPNLPEYTSLLVNRTDGDDLLGKGVQLLNTTGKHVPSNIDGQFGDLLKTVKSKIYPDSYLYSKIDSESDESRFAVLYRIEHTGDIQLRGSFANNKDGESCGLVISDLSKFSEIASEQLFYGAPLVASDSNYLGMTVAEEFTWDSSTFAAQNIDLKIKQDSADNISTHKLFIAADKEPSTSFLLTNPKIPQQVKNRLIYQGFIQLNATINGITNQAIGDDFKKIPLIADSTLIGGFDINVVLPCEKLALIEQLTAFYPSSLLFRSPRLGIVISWQRIPKRAKKIWIFRTKATHKNDYDNTAFGLVEVVDLDKSKSESNDTYGDSSYSPMGGKGGAFYYFDDKLDDNLDFTTDINYYKGLLSPLQSSFNITINERTYYANFVKLTEALKPKGYIKLQGVIDQAYIPKSSHKFKILTYNRSDLRSNPSNRIYYDKWYSQKDGKDISKHRLSFNGSDYITNLPYQFYVDGVYSHKTQTKNMEDFVYIPNQNLTSCKYDDNLVDGIYQTWFANIAYRNINYDRTLDYSQGGNTNEYWNYPAAFGRGVAQAKIKRIWFKNNKDSESKLIVNYDLKSTDTGDLPLIDTSTCLQLDTTLKVKIAIDPSTQTKTVFLKVSGDSDSFVREFSEVLLDNNELFYIYIEYEDIPSVLLSDYVFSESNKKLEDWKYGMNASPMSRICKMDNIIYEQDYDFYTPEKLTSKHDAKKVSFRNPSSVIYRYNGRYLTVTDTTATDDALCYSIASYVDIQNPVDKKLSLDDNGIKTFASKYGTTSLEPNIANFNYKDDDIAFKIQMIKDNGDVLSENDPYFYLTAHRDIKSAYINLYISNVKRKEIALMSNDIHSSYSNVAEFACFPDFMTYNNSILKSSNYEEYISINFNRRRYNKLAVLSPYPLGKIRYRNIFLKLENGDYSFDFSDFATTEDNYANDLNMLRNIYIPRFSVMSIKIYNGGTYHDYMIYDSTTLANALQDYPYGRIITPTEITYSDDSQLKNMVATEDLSATPNSLLYKDINVNPDVPCLNPNLFIQPKCSLAVSPTTNGEKPNTDCYMLQAKIIQQDSI